MSDTNTSCKLLFVETKVCSLATIIEESSGENRTLVPSISIFILMSCDHGNVWIRTGCIFTYNGSTNDLILNYFVFFMNLIYCAWYSGKCTMMRTRRNNDPDEVHHRSMVLILCLLGVIAFQWILCLGLQCSGISVIWCAMFGWTILDRGGMYHRSHQQMDSQNRIGRHNEEVDNEEGNRCPRLSSSSSCCIYCGILAMNISLMMYYGWVAAPVTTVAHVCALTLGAIMHRLISFCSGTTTTTSTTTTNGTSSPTSGSESVVRLFQDIYGTSSAHPSEEDM